MHEERDAIQHSDVWRGGARRLPGGYAWVVLAVVFLAGVAATLTQYEVPPLMPLLMKSFSVGLATAGWLISIFAVTGVVLALPAGWLLGRVGPKAAGTLALAAIVLGGIAGALSGSFQTLLLSRAIEGVGLALIAVVAPTVIAMWFPPQSRGIPMGIWATWVPVGGVLMLNSAPEIAGADGWQLVWWIAAGVSLLVLICFGIFVRSPGTRPDTPAVTTRSATDPPPLRAVMSNPSIWLLALVFCVYLITRGALTGFYPTFLATREGFSLANASSLTSLSMAAVLISCPVAGVISDRLGSRRLVYTIPAVVLAGSWLFPFVISGWQIPVYLVLVGLLSGAVPTAVFAAVPEVAGQPELVGMGMAILMLGQSVGYVVGPAVFGNLVENIGWVSAGLVWIPIAMASAIAGWFVKVR